MKIPRIHTGHVLGASSLLMIPFALFMSKAVAALFVATAISGLTLFFIKERSWPDLPKSSLVFFAVVVIWGIISSIWSIAPENSLHLSLPLAGTFLGGLVLISLATRLRDDERRFFEGALIIGACVGYAVLAIEIFTPLALTHAFWKITKGREVLIDYTQANYYKSGMTVAALMLWPAMGALWKKGAGTGAALLFASALFINFQSGSGSSTLAGIVAFSAFLISIAFQKRAAGIFLTLVIVSVFAMPLFSLLLPSAKDFEVKEYNLPESLYPRIFIWKFAADYIQETPILGKGLNSSRALSSEKDKKTYPVLNHGSRTLEPIPLHPHSVVLQIWLEFGAVGAIMLVVLLRALIRRLSKCDDLVLRAFGYGAFFSTLSITYVSYGIWSSWWQGSLWLTAAFATALVTEKNMENPG